MMRLLRLSLTLVLLSLAGTAAGATAPAPASPLHEGLLGTTTWQAIQGQVAKLTAGDGAAGDGFGTVSMHLDVAVVGAYSAAVGGNADQGAAYVFYRDQGGPDAWDQVAKLVAADGAAGDEFGAYVAVDGDTIVVGAHLADVEGNVDQGAAYVFGRDEGGPDAWGQVAKLIGADGAAGDEFGISVALSGDTAVVGAQYADVVDNEDAGAAYVFYRDEGGPDAWGQTAKLTAIDGAAGDRLGKSVSVDGDRAVVAAIEADVTFVDQGAAYLFHRGPEGAGPWGQVAKLVAEDGAPGDNLGHSVSISGDTVLAGALYADVDGNLDEGAAYVFYRNQSEDPWGQVARLIAADGQPGDWFGVGVSLQGDFAVVGADGADPGGLSNRGAAYVYYRHAIGLGAWGQVDKLTADDGTANDFFGYSVGISNNTAVVGAFGAEVGPNPFQGAAYVYELPGLHLGVLVLIKAAGANPHLLALARVHDQEHLPVAGVTVVGTFQYPNYELLTQQAATNENGVAHLIAGYSGYSGVHYFCVRGIANDGYAYTPHANDTTPCRSINVQP